MSKDASTWEWEKQGRYLRWYEVFGTEQWEVDKHWYVLFGFLHLRGKPAVSDAERKISLDELKHFYDLSSSFPVAMTSQAPARKT